MIAQTLAALSADLGELTALFGDDWDILLVGDGSGCGRGSACGFACLSVDRASGKTLTWFGGFNRGSVNAAELTAYLQALNHYANLNELGQVARVTIVTDSQYVKNGGQQLAQAKSFDSNAGLWAAVRTFARFGLVVKWQWHARDQVGLNTVADALSKLARRVAEQYALAGAAVGLESG